LPTYGRLRPTPRPPRRHHAPLPLDPPRRLRRLAPPPGQLTGHQPVDAPDRSGRSVCRCPARIRPPAVSGRDPHIPAYPRISFGGLSPTHLGVAPRSPGRRGREADTTPEFQWNAVTPRWVRALCRALAS